MERCCGMQGTREMRIRRCTTWVAPLITMFFFLFVSVSALAAPASKERLSDPFLEKEPKDWKSVCVA